MFVSSELNLSEQIIPHHLSNSKIESIGNFTSFCGGYFLWVDQSHLINQAQIYRKFECECLKVGLAWMQIWMRMPHGWLGMDSLYHLCPPILTCTLYQTIVWRPQVRFPEPAVRQYPPSSNNFLSFIVYFFIRKYPNHLPATILLSRPFPSLGPLIGHAFAREALWDACLLGGQSVVW